MNIFLRELKANAKALAIWGGCMFLLVISGMGKYTAYSSGGGQMNDVFSSLPHSIRALLGFGAVDITSMPGYFALLFLYIELTAAVHAVLLGSGIIAKEERDKTTEFLMVKPVSRAAVLTGKLLAALVNVLVVNAAALISSVAMVSFYNKGADISREIAMFMLSMLIVQLVFLSLGAALAAAVKNPKTSGSLAGILLFTAFVISKITDLTDRADVLNVLSPFKYFSYQRLAAGEAPNGTAVVLSLLLCAAFCLSVYYLYPKRDLRI